MSDSAAGAEGTQVPLRVLVVDDAEDIRDLTVRMVTKLGHVADQAADGVEAVEALAARHYDLILLDLSMPRMSGEDVVRWMRDHPEHGDNVRIVVVSAWAGDHRPTLNELGVTDVLPKPFRRQQLSEILDQTTGTDVG